MTGKRLYRRVPTDVASLAHAYLVERKSMDVIASERGVTYKVVRSRLREAGVKMRTHAGSRPSRYPGKVRMRDLYVDQRLSLRGAAKVLGVSSPVVRAWLAKAGVDRRTIGEAKRGQSPAPQAILASVRARRKHALPGRPEVGYTVNDGGYVLLLRPGHPMADSRGYVKEHRLVLAEKIGRALRPAEDGHHENRIRHDNDPGNLSLMASRSDHQREHAKTRRRVEGRFA